MFLFKILCLLLCMSLIPAPAIKKTPSPQPDSDSNEEVDADAADVNTGLFYDQYLQQVIQLLESDAEFKKKMEKADFEEIRAGKLSNAVNFMPQNVRDKLNEIKKEEMRRLRKIVHAKGNLDKGRKVQSSQYLRDIANHLDHDNPHSFEAADLTNLIKAATNDLENFDKERHEDFKKYEMKKELQREEKMKMLNELEREKAREEYINRQKEMAENNGIHHPASKEQLKEVWETEDGLKEEEFNPKTFFYIHDLNGDAYLDGMELEALFEKDLGNAYNESDPDFDYMQMEEERRRMREHVMKEVDKDGNGLISLDEFLAYTNTNEFSDPDENSYKTIDQLLSEHSLYTKEELEKYRGSIAEQEAEIKRKIEILKEEAKALGGMRKELSEEKQLASEDGHIEEDEKLIIEDRELEIKEQEQKLQEIHKDLQQQSKEVLKMKQEVKKHEIGEKVAEQIQERIDNAPEGEEKEKAIQKAHEDLEKLKKAQGVQTDGETKEAQAAEVQEPGPGDPSQGGQPQQL